MKLQFDNIVSFVTVVEEGSFSAAARKIKKSQSTVSTAVQNLELDLGFCLFNRNKSKFFLTDKGRRFFHLFSPIVAKYNESITIAIQMNISNKIVYRIGIDPLVFNKDVKKALLDFSESFPNVDLVIVTKPSFVLGNYINEGKIDLALGNPYHKTSNDFNIDELFHVNCWWVVHEDLASVSSPPPLNRILLMDGSEELLNLSNIASYNLWKLDDLDTILDLCKAQKGMAFLPEFLIEDNMKENNLKYITDHPDFFSKRVVVSLFWPMHSHLSLFSQWFKSELENCESKKPTFVAKLTQ